jgi:DNA-binding MarR family transcriptional regulator
MQVNQQTDRLTRLSTELVRRLQLLERQELASCCGVPLSRSVVLRVLDRRGDQRMSALAEELGVAQSTATRLVEPLVADGLVERRRARDDGRAVEVALTAEGHRRAKTVLTGSRRCCEGILERIPADRRQQVIDSLELVVRAVSDCCSPGCGDTEKIGNCQTDKGER